MDLNRTKVELDREARNNENENWEKIENKFNDFSKGISDDVFDRIIDESKIDWEQMVDKVSDLPQNAETGETRGVKDDNKIYRYDGNDWIPIAEINLNPIAEVDQRLTTQLAEKADEQTTNNSLNALRNQKVDEITFDNASQVIKFYANGNLVDTIDITEASNASLIQDYIDSLVSDGLIEGVNLADYSVDSTKLADESVTSSKLEKNYRSKFPYYSDDTFDLDYLWENKTVIASANVKNNPFGTGCEVIAFRGKTTPSISRVWVTQIAVSYGSSGVLGETKIRHVIGDESTNELIDKSEWKKVTFDKITREMMDDYFMVGEYLSGNEFDLNKIITQGNYMINANVVNNPLPTSGLLKVDVFELSKDENTIGVTQKLMGYGTFQGGRFMGKEISRTLSVNKETGAIFRDSGWSSTVQEDIKTIKILTIGNSFGLDATKYVHRICQSADINVMCGNLYISGGLFEDHYENITNDNKVYRFYRRYHIDGTITDDFLKNYSVDDALNLEEWDYVFFNQASAQSGVYDTFQPYLNDIISYVKSKQPNIKIALMPTWAYSSDFDDTRFDKYDRDQLTMYNDILDAYKEAMSDVDFDVIIPSGTAIQNARTDEYLNNIERELTRDGYHLSDVGCFIAGMAFFRALIDKQAEVDYIPDTVHKKATFFGKVAAKNAVLNPFQITDI